MLTNSPLSQNSQKIQELLARLGLDNQVLELPDSTRTSSDAAKAVKCSVGQIAKSLIFKTKSTNRPILIIASGSNRVNEKALRNFVPEKVSMASPDFVKEKTGFIVGGIPPAGHITQIETFIDQDLMKFKKIWAAAGTPHSVFKLTPQQLVDITNGKVIDITNPGTN